MHPQKRNPAVAGCGVSEDRLSGKPDSSDNTPDTGTFQLFGPVAARIVARVALRHDLSRQRAALIASAIVGNAE
jgi:hypothetical protein